MYACVCGAEKWTLKASDVHMLRSYFPQLLHLDHLTGTRYSQWKEHITTKQLSARFGMAHSIADYLLDKRL